MGGDRITSHSQLFTPDEEINSPVDDSFDFPQLSSVDTSHLLRSNDNLRMKWGGNGFEEGTAVGRELDCRQANLSMKCDEGNGLVFVETRQECSDQFSNPASCDSEVDQRRRDAVFREVLQSYDQLRTRIGSLNEAKNKILSYTPGAWIENVGGMTLSDYVVPKTTSLLLIGPKGSGKSSLVNRISKVFEDDKFASERAQVTYNSSVGDGTYFLQEYMIPRGSNSFSLYDTRSLSDDASDNIIEIKRWITDGVRHRKLVIRKSDSLSLRNRMKCKAREIGCECRMVRMVNFVIFVVDGLAVLKSMEGNGDVEKQYNQMISTTFNCPYLSFRDDKPAVVVTHGDLLSLTERARVRTYLGELLGIPPAKQIFDIPESCDPENELVIVDTLRYCLEHADRNLSCTTRARNKGFRVFVSACIHLLLIMWIAILAFKLRRAPKSKSHIDWHAIRHLWLDED